MLNPEVLPLLGILPSLPHMEDAHYQQQVIPAIAIIPHSISDSSEMTLKLASLTNASSHSPPSSFRRWCCQR